MSEWKEKAEAHLEETMRGTRLPRWLWPSVYAVVLIVAVVALIQVFH